MPALLGLLLSRPNGQQNARWARCVASRCRWALQPGLSGEKSGSASLASHTPSGPNPLGENQSLSSPPLKPRGLLLSVMRQKVGKERSQGVFAPLAIPPDWAANHQPRKFGLAPIPLRLCKTPVGVPSGTAEDDDLKVAIIPAQNSISCLPPHTAFS